MTSPLDALPPEARAHLVSRPQPDWLPPMLATLTEKRFSDPAWIYERKLDGERCLASRNGRTVRLWSRNHKPIDNHYPELAEAVAAQPATRFIVDGEIVAFEGRQTSFALLQPRMQISDPERARRTGIPVFLYLFDVLHADGFDLTGLELRHRKAALRRLLAFRDPLRFATHRNRDGEAYWEAGCRKGWEGVIAKLATSTYEHRRSGAWLKFKCVNEQEFVIGGFTDPQGSRIGFGALLIGHYDDVRLVYAGKVGTGFDQRVLTTLTAQLRAIEQDRPPFDAGDLPRKGVHWVQPKLVAQIGFSEWTGDGLLRHPRFLGLREDKEPREVVRERPV